MSQVGRDRYETICEASPDAILLVDGSGRITYANRRVADLFGYSPDELVGSPQTVLHPAGEEDRYRELFERHAGEGSGMIARFPDGSPIYVETDDGEQVPVESHARSFELAGRQLIAGVFRDTTERRRYEERLEKQRDDLELLNRVLRHDVRNDLQLVGAYAEMLEAHVDEEGQEYLEIVQERADQAVELTETARDLAAVMGHSENTTCPVSLAATLEGEIHDIRSSYSDVAVTIEGSLPDVEASADDMLGAVFQNVLKNAVQHNDKDVPEVVVSAHVDDDRATVRIADDGPGVPDAQKTEIFGKGERGLEGPGTGIGLYLVRSLVDRYGGDVWVEDNEPEGAVFVVELPIVA